MKTTEIKQSILRELQELYQGEPDKTFGFGKEDADKYQVSLSSLEDILTDLHNHGLIERHADAGVPFCKITVRGIEAIEDTGEESEGALGLRLAAALKVLNEAQKRSAGILEQAETKHKTLESAMATRKRGDPLPEETGGILPTSAVTLLIQRAIVQLRGEFIAALEAIKGS